ncbi:FMN-binding protein [Chloroflexota bacterium]
MKVKFIKEIFPVIFITLVVFVSVALLSGTDSITKDRIEYQKELKIQNMLTEMFPNMGEYTFEDEIYTIYSDGVIEGFAFLATGKGYGGKIDILVGLENENTIKGITIITQGETPGLGSRVTESSFTGGFAGITIDGVALKKDGGQVDALTGATISSQAVAEAVRTTALEKVKSLKERE